MTARVLALLLGTLLLSGCAGLCGDRGTRTGAWGLILHCTSTSRPQEEIGAQRSAAENDDAIQY
jgi:hypothetical protein